jgi:hypothetical protein
MADEEQVEAPAEPVNEFEERARKTGWSPLEDFPGKPEKWMDAKTWVERGETFIPFLRQSNQTLKGEVATLQQQLMEERRLNQMRDKALAELQENAAEQRVQDTTEAREGLVEQIVAAHEANDLRLELKLRDDLAELNERLREAKRKPAVQPTPSGSEAQLPPAIQTAMEKFTADNPWFKDDQMMAAAAVAAMDVLNKSGKAAAMTPEQKFDYVATEVRKRFGMNDNPRRNAAPRVEGSRMDGSGAGSNGRAFEDLPAEAKRQCDQLAKRFVGKTDAGGAVKYKTIADYRARYASDYFDESWGKKVLTQ